MTHYVDFTDHLWWFSCSSFIFSWIFLMSTASFILLSCRLLLPQDMSDGAAEYPQMHRLETESAGGSIPFSTFLLVSDGGVTGAFYQQLCHPSMAEDVHLRLQCSQFC